MLVFSPHVVVHRIGRTGRCGKTGIATTFINKLCGKLPSTCTVITLHFFLLDTCIRKRLNLNSSLHFRASHSCVGNISTGCYSTSDFSSLCHRGVRTEGFEGTVDGSETEGASILAPAGLPH